MRVMRPLWALPLVASVISLSLCSFAVAQDDAIQAATDNLTKSVNGSTVRQVKQTSKKIGVATDDNVTVVTCTGEDGQPQNVEVRGLMKNTVIVNCQTDEDGQPHIKVKGDGTIREIGVVRVEGGAENVVIVNDRHLGPGTNISVEGKNAKASVGNVEVKGGKLKDATIVNRTVIDGGTIEAKGDGASVSIGTVTIGGDDNKK